MEGVWLEISCQELWPNFLLARAKAQPIDYYYYYPPAWIYSFAIIGSEKDNEWPGILNVVDTDIVGVLKSWALVGMSWPKVASSFWIIHSRSDSATIGRRNGNFPPSSPCFLHFLFPFLVSTNGVISPGSGRVVSPTSGPRPHAGVWYR